MTRTYSAAMMIVVALVASWLGCMNLSVATAQTGSVSNNAIAWTEEFEAAVQRANATSKPLLLHFYGDYCPPCKLLEKKTFHDPKLIGAINNQFVAVKINADKRRDLADHYQVTRWPTDVYLLPSGDELFRTVSPQDPVVYAQVVDRMALRHRDWTVEQNALAAAHQREQDRQLAARGPQGDPSRKIYSGTEGRPVRTQSAQWNTNPDPTSEPVNQQAAQGTNTLVGTPINGRSPTHGQRVIENPFLTRAETAPSDAMPSQGVSAEYASTKSPARSSPAKQQATSPKTIINPNVSDEAAPRPVVSNAPKSGNDSPLAMAGYCPVRLREKSEWIEGSPSFAVRHRGRIYYCSDEASRQTLLKNPDLYTPALSGYDIVHFANTGERLDGKIEHGCIQESSNRYYFFASEENLNQFERDSATYSRLLEDQQRERVANQPSSSSRY